MLYKKSIAKKTIINKALFIANRGDKGVKYIG